MLNVRSLDQFVFNLVISLTGQLNLNSTFDGSNFNLNSKQLRFHGAHPNVDAYLNLVYILIFSLQEISKADSLTVPKVLPVVFQGLQLVLAVKFKHPKFYKRMPIFWQTQSISKSYIPRCIKGRLYSGKYNQMYKLQPIVTSKILCTQKQKLTVFSGLY